MEEEASETGKQRGGSGAKKVDGEQVEGGKSEISGTGCGGRQEWTFVQVDR